MNEYLGGTFGRPLLAFRPTMSRTMFQRSACARVMLAGTAKAGERLPTTDPISTATPTEPCKPELIGLSQANSNFFDATALLLQAWEAVELADANLGECLCNGGDCRQEQSMADQARQVADNAQLTVDLAAEAVDDANAAIDDCRCNTGGGNGPGDPPEPDPFPPAFAIMSDKGLSGVVNLVARQ